MKNSKLSTLEKKLDTIFSQFIRLRDSRDGFVKCVSCPNIIHWKEAHCCHFVRRSKRATRWDETNCYAGCNYCNTYNEGMHYYHLAKHINRIHGEGYTDKLIQKGNKDVKISRLEINELIEIYRLKVAELNK